MAITKINNVKWLGYGINVMILHVAGIGCLLFSASDHPALTGLAFLAYSLGLRHAFDADHIAGIDNTVRKLVQQGKNPAGVGFYFSLGHSTVVCMMALAIAFTAQWAENKIPFLKDIGGIIGTSVSGIFLILIGVLNLIVLRDIYTVLRKMQQKADDGNKLEDLLHGSGLLMRYLSPLFKFINKSWHVYPIGFLFGLGFDTASEISLLVISAGAAKGEVGLAGIMALPLLFAAGMSLLDTADGIFMATAYDWAFRTPLRKVYYNFIITGLSVVAALFIGLTEVAQVIASQLGLTEGAWKWLQELDLGSLGYILVVIFVLTWLTSYGVWKFRRLHEC